MLYNLKDIIIYSNKLYRVKNIIFFITLFYYNFVKSNYNIEFTIYSYRI